MQEPLQIYESIGGGEPYHRLVAEFYKGVEQDPVLRPLYPEDLSEPKEHLALFLIQRTGGPMTYNMKRGHPRMRMRHMPFRIRTAERDAWMTHMRNALNTVPEFKEHMQPLELFFSEFATFLINHPD